jgi:N-acetylglucosamine kinase-like BadF-type ATPase
MSDYIIGVDGGGTKTLALVADLDGNVLGRGVSGPSNYQIVGAEAAFAALEESIHIARKTAGVENPKITAICLGIGGVSRPEDIRLFNEWAKRHYPGIPASIGNDIRLVLAAGTPKYWGIALISGTGSIAWGRSPDGKEIRVGGWGYLLGDEGSGYAMGISALKSVSQEADGRAPKTSLTPRILEHWSLKQPSELINKVYRPEISRAEIARLAELIDTAATEDYDDVANDILENAGIALAQMVASVAQQLGLENTPIPCALAGSVLVSGQGLRPQFEKAMKKRHPEIWIEPIQMVSEPALGAIRGLVKGFL